MKERYDSMSYAVKSFNWGIESLMADHMEGLDPKAADAERVRIATERLEYEAGMRKRMARDGMIMTVNWIILVAMCVGLFIASGRG